MLREVRRSEAPPETGTGRQPKHAAIADTILRRIESGEWKPGDRLPSETRLCAELRASLGTVQKALQRLSEKGILVREHGRGTFVSRDQIPESNVRHFRFLDEDGVSILPIESKVFGVRRIDTKGPWARFLGEDEGYIRIERTLSINGEFDVYSEVFLAAARLPDLLQMAPSELDDVSIRDYLSARLHLPTLSIEQTIRVQMFPPRVTSVLRLPADTVGLVWEIGGFTYRDMPLTWQRAFVPPSDRPLQMPGGWE